MALKEPCTAGKNNSPIGEQAEKKGCLSPIGEEKVKNMYAICALDSEHYCDPDLLYEKDIQQIGPRVNAYMKEAYPGYTCEKVVLLNEGDKKERYEYSLSDDYDKRFVVIEVFYIPDDAIKLVVSWHAYEGVDFEVTACRTRGEAIAVFREKGKNILDSDNIAEVLENNTELVIVDNGEEWNCLMQISVPKS